MGYGAPSVPPPKVAVELLVLSALCDDWTGVVPKELGKKPPSKRGSVLAGADGVVLQEDRGGVRHREHFHLVPTQPLPVARSCGSIARSARHVYNGQLQSRDRAGMIGTRRSLGPAARRSKLQVVRRRSRSCFARL
jgi:hypothetical protein